MLCLKTKKINSYIYKKRRNSIIWFMLKCVLWLIQWSFPPDTRKGGWEVFMYRKWKQVRKFKTKAQTECEVINPSVITANTWHQMKAASALPPNSWLYSQSTCRTTHGRRCNQTETILIRTEHFTQTPHLHQDYSEDVIQSDFQMDWTNRVIKHP